VNVSPQSRVIGEIPSVVVGIGIEHDVVVIPEPVAGIVVVVWRDLEVEAVDVESLAAAAVKPPDVPRADRAIEASVFPGMIEMIVGIVASGVVSHPLVILRVDVRGFGMVRLIAEGAPLLIFLRRWRGTAIGLRAGGWRTTTCR
jgi:hypothetical protein